MNVRRIASVASHCVPFCSVPSCVPRLACRISFLIIVINARLLITIKCWLLLFLLLFFVFFLLLFLPFFILAGYLPRACSALQHCVPFLAGSTIKHLINTIKASDLARRTSLKEMPKSGSKDKDDNDDDDDNESDNDNEDDIKINIKQKGSDKRKPARAVGDETCLQLPERYKSGIKTFFYEPKFKPAHKHTLARARAEASARNRWRERREIEKKRHDRGEGSMAEERARVPHLWQENPPKCATPGRGVGVQGEGAWQCFGTGTWQVFTQINARFCATLRHFHFHSLSSLGHFLLPLFVCYTFVFAARLTALVSVCVCVCLLFCHCLCCCCC